MSDELLEDSPEAACRRLEDRSYKTYRSRLVASQRLQARGQSWNAALVALSAAAVIASVGLLADTDLYGGQGDLLMVCVAVLTLVASLTTANVDYSGRSRNMFLSYRRIQRLSAQAEFQRSDPDLTRDAVRTLTTQYDALLDESENHSESDYWKAFPSECMSPSQRRRALRQDVISTIPYLALILPVLLLFPVGSAILEAWI